MAAEFGISIGARISEYLVEPILIRPFRPIFCFKSIVDDFHDQNKRLISIQEKVRNDVQRDNDNALVIYHNVEEWVEKVNTSMQEVRRVENELVQNKSCFRYSWCPNWTCHYSFSRQVSKTAATMKTLCEEGNSFSSVSHPPALHQDIIGSSSSAPFMHSLSSKSAFDRIMVALERDNINLIRLYGVAGAGKTTMAQLVGEEAKKLFYRVILVLVSQHPQVRSLQGVIADFLSLQFDQLESEQGRAAKLQLRLKKAEKILIIFDDVQKEFNLGAVIGIPSLDSGCKILLTTHAEIHVQTQMDIRLGVLSEDEAWTLLKSTAGVGDEVRTYDMAKDAIEQCNGLPKAIVAMGTVLNGKGVHEWGETLQQHKVAKFKFIDSLEEGVKNLSLRQDRVSTQIKMAKQKVEEIYPDVEKWLKDVERVMNDVEQFKKALNHNRWCFDELGVATRVEALVTSVNDLQEQGNFDKVSHPTPLEPDIRLLSSEDFMFSEAAKSAFDQILKAWKTDSVNMIGLYGMGGIGKTTLASQVHNEVIRQNALAVVVTVSQKPDVGNMQDKIADILDLTFQKRTLDQRAIELKSRLQNEKILIILDDVWKRFDLRSIGITLDDCKDCKILMTTRGRDVCSSMNCQSEIQLYLFSEDESQKLFKKKAGLPNELELDDAGKQIVAECKRLPIALETVGAVLKRKGKDEWVEALEKLRSARLVDIIGVDNDEKNVYRCLQVSYDYLKDQPQGSEAQFLLLLCSLFPDDYEIEVEDLTKYAFGMKLFEKVESIEDARRKVRVAIRFLRDSCLLLDDGGKEYVKMHDVVRDVLLWIGGTKPRERNTFTVRDGVHLKDLIRKKSFQNCKALSFTSDVIPKFSKYNEVEFPNLEIVLIFMKYDQETFELGEGFFEHMKLLKVLDVRGPTSWRSCKFAMPQSLQCLEHLRTLMLRNCDCSNSSILRDLGRLRILSLRSCRIDCRVEVLSGLKKLRFLDFTGFGAERMMLTSDVIERLVKLEELYGYRLSKFTLPSNLVAWSVEVKDVRCLFEDYCFPNLPSYDIHIGLNRAYPSNIREVRRLELRGNIKDILLNTCKKLLPTVQLLRLFRCDDLYSLPSLPMLERLEVDACQNMECVLKVGNVNNDNSFVQILSLRTLHLFHLSKLRHIWEGPTRLLSLCNLTKVVINYCPKLICIFSSPSVATSLQQLEILGIERCHNLEEIFSSKGGSDDDDFACCCFTNLRELKVSDCDKVITIFPLMKSPQSHCCHFPKLKSIVLPSNRLLKHIWEGPIRLLSLCNLTEVMIIDCPELICVFSSPSVTTSLQQLEILQIEGCHKLEEIFSRRGGNDNDDFTGCCFTSLRELKVSDCDKVITIFPLMNSAGRAPHLHLESYRCHFPKLESIVLQSNRLLKHIWEGPTRLLSLCNLTKVVIIDCLELICIFSSSSIATSLQQLEVLQIEGCHNLEDIFSRRGGSDDDDLTCFCFTNLREVKVYGCHKVKAIFPLVKSTGRASHLDPQSHPFRLPKLQKIVLEKNRLLQHIWEGPPRLLSLCNLIEVTIINCPELICVFSSLPYVATSLQQLKILKIERCHNLEDVFSRRGVSGDDDFFCCCFTNLEELEVSGCHKLKTIFPLMKSTGRAPHLHPQSHRCHLPKLQNIVLENNFLLEHIFGHQTQAEEGVDCPSLQVLDVTRCPNISTTHFVVVATQQQASSSKSCKDNDSMSNIQMVEERLQRRPDDLPLSTITCFSLLNMVKLQNCNKLKQVFTASITTSLHLLEALIVHRCNELEQIISKVGDGKEEPTVGVCFENLKTLRVGHCGRLKTIFPISMVLKRLERLELNSNAELQHVFGRSDWDCTWQCPSLYDLCLKDCPKLCTEFTACIQNPSTAEAVKKIKIAHIQGDDGNRDDDLVTSPSKNLSPWNSEVVKFIQHGPKRSICFAVLCQIKIIGFHKLKHLFTTNVVTVCPNLKRLIVRRCNELEVIMVEDGKNKREDDATPEMIARVGFENLEVLHVSNCKKLKTVFSTFIPLPKLDTLLLHSNAVLESLFGQSDCDCTSRWTRLSVLSVTGCPKLCTETIAIVKSQLEVQSRTKAARIINLSYIEGLEELIQIRRQEGGDVDQTTCLDSQFVKVEELGDLERICSGPTQDISFSFLYALKVMGCSRLKQLFTVTMATSLHNLGVLWVERCDDLEQVIEEEEGNEENNEQLEFSNLDTLRLIDLPKLISFCPTSCNLVFTKLTEDRLKVKDCPKPITDFFSQQSYLDKDEYQYYRDYDGEDDDEEDGTFGDATDRQYCTYKFAWALFEIYFGY